MAVVSRKNNGQYSQVSWRRTDDLWEWGCTRRQGQGRAGDKDWVMGPLCPAATTVRQAAVQFFIDPSSESGPVSQRTGRHAQLKAQEQKTQAGGLPGSWLRRPVWLIKTLYPGLNCWALTQGSLVSSLLLSWGIKSSNHEWLEQIPIPHDRVAASLSGSPRESHGTAGLRQPGDWPTPACPGRLWDRWVQIPEGFWGTGVFPL